MNSLLKLLKNSKSYAQEASDSFSILANGERTIVFDMNSKWKRLDEELKQAHIDYSGQRPRRGYPQIPKEKIISFDKIFALDLPKKVPLQVLSTLLDICQTTSSIDRLMMLIDKYPTILMCKTSSGLLPIQLVFERHAWDIDVFREIVYKGMDLCIGGMNGYGGLLKKTSKCKACALNILNSRIITHSVSVEAERKRKSDFFSLIQDAVLKSLLDNQKVFVDSTKVPLLHAVLMMNCPENIIMSAMRKCQHDRSLFTSKFLGDMPIDLAVRNLLHKGGKDVLLHLVRWYPETVRDYDETHGADQLLHKVLQLPNTGNDTIHKDISIIGAIVEELPEALLIQNSKDNMYPFQLAACHGWSLDIIYGLMRTNLSVSF
ncbi:predicted protein [Chaetoceros tenuissimus]|uniref:Uncharacterized protein n=1 Tax=Chaetoceros tenuissimus TaxID=426638 RepID=A0AAD3CP73_9STRA|nr:predicted protein [Chaetoceros tenuissimus]